MAGRSVDRVDEGILKSLGRLQAAGAPVGRAHATKRTIDVMLRSLHSQFAQVNALLLSVKCVHVSVRLAAHVDL